MFRQLKGKSYQEVKERDEVIPCVGGTVEVHKANRHPLPHPPCSSHGLLDDYDDVERVYREELGY
jgi:hypothetical protein